MHHSSDRSVPAVFHGRRGAFPVVVGFAVMGIAAGGWTRRINPDGLSYFELADRWIDSPASAINTYWSPAYSWLLAVVCRMGGRERSIELLSARALNAIILVVALFLLWRLTEQMQTDRGPGRLGAVGRAFLAGVVGIWAFNHLCGVWLVTPDLLAAGIVVAAAQIAVRVLREGADRDALLLGTALGAGYLAKAHMLPLGIALLVLIALLAPRRRRAAVLGATTFALIVGAWAISLSWSAGRVTVGEAARLNYAWYASGVERDLQPRVREDDFALLISNSPFPPTYAPWLDPAVWYANTGWRVVPAEQMKALLVNAIDLVKSLAPTIPFALALLWLGRASKFRWSIEARVLTGWCGSALLLFIPVHFESRFVAGFAAVAIVTLLSTIEWVGDQKPRLIVLAALAVPLLGTVTASAIDAALWKPRSETDVRTAEQMKQHGLRSGDGVVLLGETFDLYWARLAGTPIVAQLESDGVDRFWRREFGERDDVLGRVMQRSAGEWVIALQPSSVMKTDWSALAPSSIFLRSR